MPNILVLAETDGTHVAPATRQAITFAQALAAHIGDGFDLLVAGWPGIAGAAEAWRGFGAAHVIVAAAAELAHPTADRLAAVGVQAAKSSGARYVVAPATSFGRDFLPRLAALLDVP